jgi:hypothetical protein
MMHRNASRNRRNLNQVKENLETFIVKKMNNFCTLFLAKKIHFFEHENVAIILTLGNSAAQHTSQENESEIFLNFCEKNVVFRCRKNYRLDLLRCMPEILKMEKNDFRLFSR